MKWSENLDFLSQDGKLAVPAPLCPRHTVRAAVPEEGKATGGRVKDGEDGAAASWMSKGNGGRIQNAPDLKESLPDLGDGELEVPAPPPALCTATCYSSKASKPQAQRRWRELMRNNDADDSIIDISTRD